ncbi:MAG: hypothetical protein R6U50_05710 [Desulfobacterales bacterium]
MTANAPFEKPGVAISLLPHVLFSSLVPVVVRHFIVHVVSGRMRMRMVMHIFTMSVRMRMNQNFTAPIAFAAVYRLDQTRSTALGAIGRFFMFRHIVSSVKPCRKPTGKPPVDPGMNNMLIA